MFLLARLLLGQLSRLVCPRSSILLENLVLRQQLAVFKRRNGRPRLFGFDKLFWVLARKFWPGWKSSLLIVTPLASSRIPALWELAFSPPAQGWSKTDQQEAPRAHLPDGGGESDLGRTAHPRRTA